MNLEPLTVSGDTDNLSHLLDYVTFAAAGFGLDESDAWRLSLAVDEIATNIVLYGYRRAGIAGDLTIRAETGEDELRIFLEDTGAPFDPREFPRPSNLDQPLEERGEGGLGIYLALGGVDDFVYERAGTVNRSVFIVRKKAE